MALFRRIKNRLIVALLVVAAVPLVGIGLYSMYANTEALRELARAAARERAYLKAEKMEETLRDIRDDLGFLARSPMLIGLMDEAGGDTTLQAFWRVKLGQQFLAFAQNKGIYASLSYLDETGREVVRAECDGLRTWLVPDERMEDRGDRGYFRAAMVLPGGDVDVSTADRADGQAQEPVVRYALRTTDRQDRRQGVLVADVFARHLVQSAHRIGLSGQVQTVLLQADGAPAALVGVSLEPMAEEALGRLLAGETAVLIERPTVTVAWVPVRPVLPRVEPLWLLVDVAPREAVFASVRRFQVIFVGLVGATAGAGLVLGLFLARRIAGPLNEVKRGAQRMAGGDMAYRLNVCTGDEIQEVAEEFNRMGGALEETYRQLREREREKTARLEDVTRQLVEREKLAAVGQLAAGVAHEINNPAGIVSMFVQQLLERRDLPDVCRDKLRIVDRHADRIGRITRGLLDFARGRAYRREPVNLGRALDGVLSALDPRIAEAGVSVAAHMCDPVEGLCVMGDEEQVQQVFENLTLNAVQAMTGGGRLTVVISHENSEARVVFSDTGPGIPEEHLKRVFEPFFTTKEIGQGTGLGLSVSFGIIQSHGGHLTVQNDPNGGAIFTVVLPLEKTADSVVFEGMR